MNNVEQLNNFLQRVTSDANLTTTHVGICMALAVAWINSGFINPFNISRRGLTGAAKIKSNTTYHRIMRDLATLGYFQYYPTYHPKNGTQIFLFTSETLPN